MSGDVSLGQTSHWSGQGESPACCPPYFTLALVLNGTPADLHDVPSGFGLFFVLSNFILKMFRE